MLMDEIEPVSLEKYLELIENEQALLVYFYNDACAPCIALRPKVFEMVKNKFPKLRIALNNSMLHPEISAHFGAFNNPTLILFFGKKEYKRESKYISIKQLEYTIQRPCQMIFS